MGDTYFTVIPENPLLVPQKNAQKLAEEYIRALANPEEIEVVVTSRPNIIIGGEIDHILVCPKCGNREQTEAFFQNTFEYDEDGGMELKAKSPCCEQVINIADIQFTFSEDDGTDIYGTGGFACFQLDCRIPQPNIGKIELKEISKILGCDTRIIIRFI